MFTQYLVSIKVYNPEGAGPETIVVVMTDEGGKFEVNVGVYFSFLNSEKSNAFSKSKFGFSNLDNWTVYLRNYSQSYFL